MSTFKTNLEDRNKCQRVCCLASDEYAAPKCSFQDCDSCSILAQIDEEILNIHNQLSDLTKKRRDLQNKINSRHDRLINRLPIELVSEIFVLAAEFDPIAHERSRRERGYKYTGEWSPILRLGAVSKHWRDITIGLPRLWSTITIHPFKDFACFDIIKEWLHRSGALPLSITFKCDITHRRPMVQKTEIEPVLALLRSQSARWSSIFFKDVQSLFLVLDGLLNGLEDPPQIDSLWLCHLDRLDRLASPTSPFYMHKPFRPKNLRASGGFLARMPLKWDNLLRLEVQFIRMDELVHIICHGKKLKHCLIKDIQSSAGYYPLPTEPIVNHSLNDLGIVSSSEGVNILRYITFPSLQVLEYTFEAYDGEMDILVDFLDRSRAPIHTFTFHCHIADESIWYDRLPHVTHLELDLDYAYYTIDSADNFLKALAHGQAVMPLPNLQILEVNTYFVTSIRWSLIANIFPGLPQHQVHNEGPPDILDTNPTHLSIDSWAQRPLKKFYLRNNGVMQREVAERWDAMGKETYFHLLNVRKSGVELDMMDGDGVDRFQHASDLYDDLYDDLCD